MKWRAAKQSSAWLRCASAAAKALRDCSSVQSDIGQIDRFRFRVLRSRAIDSPLNFYQHFPGVLALKHRDECLHRFVEAFHDILAVFDLSFFEPLCHLNDPFTPAALPPGDDEAFHF